MKVMVFGANGQVGRELIRAGWSTGTEVTSLTRADCDITDPSAITAVLRHHPPDLIINAAAYTAVDQAESDIATAFAANDHGPLLLALAASQIGAPVIHLSTDYVFDGTSRRPYVESDAVAPMSAYGQSKASGEAQVRLRQPQHIIVRTSWVYASHGRNFVKTMLRLAAERDEVAIVADQWGTPTAARSIAAAIVTITERIADAGDLRRPWGTYHFADKGETTWYGFAEHIFNRLKERGMRRPRLRAISTEEYPTPARRPANSRLDCSLIERTFGIVRTPWQASLDGVLDEFLSESPRISFARCETCEL